MKLKITYLLIVAFSIFSCKKEETKKPNEKTVTSTEKTTNNLELKITPISHATAVLTFNDEVIYLDPTLGQEAFSSYKKPTYVLITDIHGDHMDLKTLNALDLSSTKIIAPKAVAEKITTINAKEIIVMNNSETKSFTNFTIEAIPMYNLRKEALKFHSKGRGNGYILTINNERIYFSGDTEDIPEMRNLKNIDKAFVCMNLPYTMTVESAADAVLSFKPKQVYPYHYRGTEGLSDVSKFKEIVNKNNNSIEVVQLDWYPNRK
ncbi:MBL fold metallo-hydrolase [uncultured Polaribacter sp.]|uniref:MBL fold metallo-hydrolase n=1 Tax=uncultured Polaribacter sp. TaxID=174711 RepID=UPI0026282274|nr:MBL fold metallo-hydrolase [uncultured Polaribacter sp.]